MVTNGMSRASSRSPPVRRVGAPRRARDRGGFGVDVRWERRRARRTRPGCARTLRGTATTAAGVWTTGAGIVRPRGWTRRRSTPARPVASGSCRSMNAARFVGCVAHGDEVEPAERGGLAPHRGRELGVLGLEEVAPEEHDRAAHAVQRQAVLRAVGEDLLFGARATRRVHDARARDREEAVFADAVREVLRDVRGETCGRFVDVHPRGNAETLAAVRPSPPDFERGFHVARRDRVVGSGAGASAPSASSSAASGAGAIHAPRLAASMTPGPPPVATVYPARVRVRPSRATSR